MPEQNKIQLEKSNAAAVKGQTKRHGEGGVGGVKIGVNKTPKGRMTWI